MAIKTPPQVIVNESTDSSLNHIYTSDLQSLSGLDTVGTVYITNKQEYVTNYFNDSKPGGVSGEVQLNIGGKIDGDSGFTYEAETDSLSIAGTVFAGNVRTDNLLYANGEAWSLGSGGGTNYTNANVAAYLPTYTGNVGAGNLKTNNLLYANGVAWNFEGTYSNSNVASYLPTYAGAITATSVTAATLNGSATRAGTVTASAQPNIRSVGSLTSLVVSGTTALGLVGNIQIDGGTSGQFLTTNGSGSLSWTNVPSTATPSLQAVTDTGATTSQKISITNDTDSTSYSSASALKVAGGVSIAKSVHAGMHISTEQTFFAGHLADFSSWTFPKFIGRDAGQEYIQGALVNTNEAGSADWVAYGDQSDDMQGWADFGFTSSNFSDPTYSITKSNDGYFIVQGMPGVGGNLVIATGDLGGPTHRDIVFATGGFLLEDERMRLNHEDSTFYVGAHGEDGGTNVTNLSVNGNVDFQRRTTLGSIANVKISGGTAGQVLTTDGTGNLSFSTVSGGGDTGNITFTDTNLNSTNGNVTITFDQVASPAVVFSFTTTGEFTAPQIVTGGISTQQVNMGNVVQVSNDTSVNCPINVDTVIYTGTGATQHTFKVLLLVEGVEDPMGSIADTQSCEMMIAKGFRNDAVAGSVYGLAYTSINPLATFSTRWNSSISRVEVLCRPASTTNSVTVRSFVTEMTTTD